MLKNLFLPEKFGNYYLFSKRILGFDVGKTHITATQVFVHGHSTFIEKIITEMLPQGTPADYPERVSKTITSILDKANKYDTIVSALSASVVLFKELSLPFTNKDKIKLVLEYEIESLLPFGLDQAVLDFIITDAGQEKTTVLVAVAQKNQLADHLALFEAAGVHPQIITVDLFSLYGLFKELPGYKDEKNNSVLAILGFSSTKMAYLVEGKLKLIRTIPKGVTTLVKNLSDGLHLSPHDAHEQLMRFGFAKADNSDYSAAASEALDDFLRPFQFTLQSFAKETKTSIQKIFLLGGGAQIKDCALAIAKPTQIPTELFNVDSIINHDHIRIKDGHHIDPSAIVSLSTALPTPINETFNLRAREFGIAEQTTLFLKQAIIAGSLILLALGTLLASNFIQVRKLNNSIAKSEKQIFTTVNQTLGISLKRVNDAVDEARRSVEDQERTWFSFTAQTRASFLNQLQTLSRYIDKKGIGLQLKKLSFTHDLIRMQGEVRDIPSLVIFEEELKQANLGTFISPQEPAFAITITLKKKPVEG
jgi:type IV pilus assembly protein PilM